MANTIITQEVWANRLAQRLDKPQNWKEITDVMYTDTQTTVLPYVSAANEPSVTTGLFTSAGARSTLSNVIVPNSITMATETLQIVTTDYDSVYVDYADQAQSNYAKVAELADLLGKKLGERVESIVLAEAANRTNFGDTGGGVLGLASTQITVTATNVDDIIRGIIEQIYTANGFDLYRQNGGFIVWRPADWTFLVQFMQANGFNLADAALKNGGQIGIDYMGLNHYVSTLHTANHLFAGVRKIMKLGLLNKTFGKPMFVEHPSSSTAGFLSGTQVYSRLDYGFKTQTNVAGLVFDVNVV
jgi:hypothetical protein